MGWWQIADEGGGIDFDSAKPGGLLNQFPGEDPPDKLYNGDGPADAMGNALDLIQQGKDSDEVAVDTINEIEDEYAHAWERAPKPAEWIAMFNFVSSSPDYEKEIPLLKTSLNKALGSEIIK
jgi:hypothetical protein